MSDFAAAGFLYRFEFQSKLVSGFNKTGLHLCFEFSLTLRMNNTTEPPPPYLRQAPGSACTVDLYPSPTAPLIPLYPKSPVPGKPAAAKSHLPLGAASPLLPSPPRRRLGPGVLLLGPGELLPKARAALPASSAATALTASAASAASAASTANTRRAETCYEATKRSCSTCCTTSQVYDTLSFGKVRPSVQGAAFSRDARYFSIVLYLGRISLLRRVGSGRTVSSNGAGRRRRRVQLASSRLRCVSPPGRAPAPPPLAPAPRVGPQPAQAHQLRRGSRLAPPPPPLLRRVI
jgi:hypothetical protein